MLFAQTAKPASFWPAVIGAVVGGTISLLTTLLVERQKTRRVAEEERMKRLAEAQLAARVIALELADVRSVLRATVDRSPFAWPPSPDFQFPVEAWSKYSAQFAATAQDALWNQVALAYSSLSYSNLFRNVNADSAKVMLDQAVEAVAGLTAWTSQLQTSKNPPLATPRI